MSDWELVNGDRSISGSLHGDGQQLDTPKGTCISVLS